MDTTERMQDHEILLELLREKHRRESREKIILIIVLIIAAAIIAGLIFVIPRIMRAYESYKQAMQYIDDIYKQAGPILKSATETFEEVSRIDFEGLEATIKDAEKVFRAIKNLFGG